MNCAGIVQGSDYDCLNPVQPGVGTGIILLNLEDIQSYTYGASGIVTDINLKAGKTGFLFEGVRQSVQPSYTEVNNIISVSYDHQIDFVVYDISARQKDNLERLSSGVVVGIVFNVNDVGNKDTIFEVYGPKVGLETQELSRIPWSVESGGAFQVSLKTTDEGAKESNLPFSFWDTDYLTTYNKIKDLLDTGDNDRFTYTFPFNLS